MMIDSCTRALKRSSNDYEKFQLSTLKGPDKNRYNKKIIYRALDEQNVVVFSKCTVSAVGLIDVSLDSFLWLFTS